MEMSEFEICRRVQRNGGKKAYIQILSDLNACSVFAIERILRKNGFVKKKGEWEKSKDEDLISADYNIKDKLQKLIERRLRKMESVNFTELVHVEKIGGEIMHSIDKKEAVVRDYNNGLGTYKEIAEKYGVSTWYVGNAVRTAGVLPENKQNSEKQPKKEIKDNIKMCLENPVLVPVSVDFLMDCLKDVDKKSLSKIYAALCESIKIRESELDGLDQIKAKLEKNFSLK